jgi:hypothetical protein
MLASATVAPTTYTAADAIAKYKAASDAGTLADLSQLQIQDTAANIQSSLTDLSALAKDKKLSGVVLTGTGPSLTIDRIAKAWCEHSESQDFGEASILLSD